jgi:hypothetical protein
MERKAWTEPFDARTLAEDIALSRKDLIGIRNGRGALVFVESGSVWVTQERDVRDVIVAAGEWFRLDRDGVALIQAHRAATITITAPADGAGAGVFRPEPGAIETPVRRRGNPIARRFWAAVLRVYRRHARPRPWGIRHEPGPVFEARCRPVLDPLGPHRTSARDPAAELRAAIALDTSRSV